MTARAETPVSASRPRSRRDLLRLSGRGVALGALLVAGCGRDHDEATSTPAPTATPVPTPLPEVALPAGPDEPNVITFDVIGDASEDQVVLVQYAAELARDFYFRELGFHLDGPVAINVIDSPDLPVHAATFLRDGERISSITVNVGQTAWALETPLERTKVVAHEYFHVLQNWLRASTDTSADPPFIIEGSAEYAGYATVIDAGQLTPAGFRESLIDRLRGQRIRLPALDRLTDEGPLALTSYTLFALAVDMLVATRGIAPLAKYALLRRNQPVAPSFEAAFGRSLSAFYADFAVWRRATGI